MPGTLKKLQIPATVTQVSWVWVTIRAWLAPAVIRFLACPDASRARTRVQFSTIITDYTYLYVEKYNKISFYIFLDDYASFVELFEHPTEYQNKPKVVLYKTHDKAAETSSY